MLTISAYKNVNTSNIFSERYIDLDLKCDEVKDLYEFDITHGNYHDFKEVLKSMFYVGNFKKSVIDGEMPFRDLLSSIEVFNTSQCEKLEEDFSKYICLFVKSLDFEKAIECDCVWCENAINGSDNAYCDIDKVDYFIDVYNKFQSAFIFASDNGVLVVF